MLPQQQQNMISESVRIFQNIMKYHEIAYYCQVRCQVGDLKGMWHIVTPPNWFLTDVFFGCNLWCKPQDWMTKKLVGYLVGSCSDHVRIFGWVLMISQNQQKEQSIKSGKSQPFTVQHISSKYTQHITSIFNRMGLSENGVYPQIGDVMGKMMINQWCLLVFP